MMREALHLESQKIAAQSTQEVQMARHVERLGIGRNLDMRCPGNARNRWLQQPLGKAGSVVKFTSQQRGE